VVAGAKLRRAEAAVLAARPYADQMRETLAEVARAQRESEHPLLVPHAELRRVEVVVVTSDRGLCGAFNANAIKHADRLCRERAGRGQQVLLTCAGRKAGDFFRKRRPPACPGVHPHDGWVSYAKAAAIAREVAARYVAGESDGGRLAYNEFAPARRRSPRSWSRS